MVLPRHGINRVAAVVLCILLLFLGRSNLNFYFELKEKSILDKGQNNVLPQVAIKPQDLDDEKVEAWPERSDDNEVEPPDHDEGNSNYSAWANLVARKGTTSLKDIRLFEYRNTSVFDAQRMCDLILSCVGVAENHQWGYQLLDKTAYPLGRKSNWVFWSKMDAGIGQGEGFRPIGVYANQVPLYSARDLPWRPGLTSFHGKRSNKGMVINRKTNGDGFRFISFDWNVGRLNNQLMSLEGTMGLANWYKRVVVIPGAQGKERGMENQFLGFRTGLWDMEYLGDYFDWIFHEDLPKEWQQERMPESCKLASDIGYNIPNIVLHSCVNIFLLGTRRAIVKFDSVAWGFVKYLRPSSYVQKIAEDFLKSKFSDGLPDIGAHNRMMKEGGVEGSQVYLCRQSKYSAHGSHGEHIKKLVDVTLHNEDESWKMMHAYYLSCAFNSTDLEYVLAQHSRKMPSKFFLATDNQDPKRTLDLLKHGAVMITSYEFERVSRWKQHYKWLKSHNCDATNCFGKRFIQPIERALVDMIILSKLPYFVGSWASTFTLTVCKWRGFERRHNSTLCYVEERWKEAVSTL